LVREEVLAAGLLDDEDPFFVYTCIIIGQGKETPPIFKTH